MILWALRVSNSEMTFLQGLASDPALFAGENPARAGHGDVQ